MDREILIRFLQCDTTPDEERAVVEWLEADAENKREMDRLDEVFCAAVLHVPVAPKRRMRLIPLRSRIFRHVVAAAAVVLLIVGGGYLFGSWRIRDFGRQTFVLTAPDGQRISAVLHDGTKVWLNGGSSIRYPIAFTGGERRVVVSGEAMFDVTHRSGQPFVVETHAGDIEVLGTKFNVLSDRERNIFSIALLRGKVSITNFADPDEKLQLTAGHCAELVDGHLAARTIEYEDDYLWPDGIIALNSSSFEHLIGKIERAYNIRVQLLRPEPPVVKYRGKIHIVEGVEHAMNILLTGTDCTFAIDRDANMIYIR